MTALLFPAASAAVFPVAKNGRIAYGISDGSQSDLGVMNSDGSGQTKLTNTPGLDEGEPAFSADGLRLVFAQRTAPPMPPPLELYLFDLLSGASNRLVGLAGESATTPDFFPVNGTTVAFASDGSLGETDDLYTVKTDGSGLTNLTNTLNPREEITPSYFPNGRRIAFASCDGTSCRVEVANADGTGRTPITAPPPGDVELSAAVSPDGKKIVFGRLSAGNFDVYIVNADGSGLTNLTNTPAPNVEGSPTFSPDGRSIAFAKGDLASRDIHVMNLDGSGITPLTNTPGPIVESGPSWEPIFRCGGRRATIVGSNAGERLVGTRRRDVFAANAGRDIVIGRGGNDLICLGKGRDKARAGKGKNDLCIGNRGKDKGSGCEKGKL